MLTLPDPEWTLYGKMRVARWLDPDLARRVYLELVRLERVSKAIDTAQRRGASTGGLDLADAAGVRSEL